MFRNGNCWKRPLSLSLSVSLSLCLSLFLSKVGGSEFAAGLPQANDHHHGSSPWLWRCVWCSIHHWIHYMTLWAAHAALAISGWRLTSARDKVLTWWTHKSRRRLSYFELIGQHHIWASEVQNLMLHDVLYVHPAAPGVGQPWKKWPVPDRLPLLLVWLHTCLSH